MHDGPKNGLHSNFTELVHRLFRCGDIQNNKLTPDIRNEQFDIVMNGYLVFDY